MDGDDEAFPRKMKIKLKSSPLKVLFNSGVADTSAGDVFLPDEAHPSTTSTTVNLSQHHNPDLTEYYELRMSLFAATE